MRQLHGRLAVVTGAGSGIGRATALRFAAEGMRLALADVNPESLGATAALLSAEVRCHVVDVASWAAMQRFAADVLAEQGVPDILVNNAGIGMAGPLLAMGPEDWERLMGVNLCGVVHGCGAFLPALLERGCGGHVVNLASAAAFSPSRLLPGYATSKAAVLMYTQCLRAELAPYGIGVSAICPGLVNTGIVASTAYVGGNPAENARRREAAVRLFARRNYGPERVADRIVAAVRRNRAVVPVAVEAHALRWMASLAPPLARALARADVGG